MTQDSMIRLAWVVLALMAAGVLGVAWIVVDGTVDVLAWVLGSGR